MTIEPMMLIQGMASFIGMYPQDQMLLYKICREDKFNLTVDFCSNIENHTGTAAYDAVEKEVVSFNNVISLAENLMPILFSFYIGSWSDRFGRKERNINIFNELLIINFKNLNTLNDQFTHPAIPGTLYAGQDPGGRS